MHGEAYYGWLTTRDHQAPASTIAGTAAALSATTVFTRDIRFGTLEYALRESGILPVRFEDGSDGSSAMVASCSFCGAKPPYPPAGASTPVHRALMTAPPFTDVRHERTLLQPDGAPLMELWSALRSPSRR